MALRSTMIILSSNGSDDIHVSLTLVLQMFYNHDMTWPTLTFLPGGAHSNGRQSTHYCVPRFRVWGLTYVVSLARDYSLFRSRGVQA